MHRIDTPTAVATLPTPKPAGTGGFFQDCDPANNVTGTHASADWYNMVQEELRNILAAASVTLSKTSQNQVITALQSLFGITGSKGATSNVRLGDGTTFKYGSVTIAAGTQSASVTFAAAFPTACRGVQLTHASGGTSGTGASALNATASAFTASLNGNAAANQTFHWFAYGD